ncbi:alpha-mannosidase [Streptococcus sp. DD13]|uniref:alpha-mannosidase n=1 Tax=Streptococcus sp. DD13 TaxID=1777881 RepID=UPI00079B6A23|nr:alpha-mannosidase [Streptococcus sp. DD13]KXT78955.1 Alpha-mannosidase [Streptococcus sp. DD13]
MENITVHIISHSHWDREWYQPFEAHRMQLVELFDDLFDLFENDPDFKSFHLDGQTIVLDDYLEIRPENREKLQHYIDQGKLKIGPFYILQDDYLISSEANVRNTLIGQQECKKWGKSTQIGYFPDTFGNMGQAPQILKKSGLDVAAFGRGVKPIGFDNQVLEDEQFSSQFSEMFWKGADGSQVLGILFANWYSNGNEIPVDIDEARVFWEQKLADVRAYASTNQWLLMNGCDHQPVQKNLSDAIRVANELYPEINFVHSSFEEYIQAVQAALPDNLSTVEGELTSQETDGWYTLANTSSSRIYLKQAFQEKSNLLEQVVEPLTILTNGKNYKDQLTYAWKTLLQNAPHDSICGCSVDEVHREMETRFAKVGQVAHFVKQNLLDEWKGKLDSHQAESEHLFTVVNTALHEKVGIATVDVAIATCDFKEAHPTVAYQRMADLEIPAFVVKDLDGQLVEAKVEDLGASFQYTLPKDQFRYAYIARQVRVTLPVQLAPLSWESYQLVEGQVAEAPGLYRNGVIDTPFVTVSVDKGLTVYDKTTQEAYEDFLQFEDRGDIGNEYIYFQPKGTQPILAQLKGTRVLENNARFVKLLLTHELTIPVSADEVLDQEQKGIVEFMKRTAGRSKELTTMSLLTEMTVFADSPQLSFKTRFTNTAKDHRIRLLVKTHNQSKTNDSESIYEVVTRPNQPATVWENPENPQHQQAFVSLYDEKKGVTVGNKGLNEYEILEDDTIAVTLLRATGELGDWGYFPTPEAQCLREVEVEYSLECHTSESRFAAYRRAKALQTPLTSLQITKQTGTIPAKGQALQHPALECDQLCPTAYKVSEDEEAYVLRYYNMSQERLAFGAEYGSLLNLLEEPIEAEAEGIQPQEIRTERIARS